MCFVLKSAKRLRKQYFCHTQATFSECVRHKKYNISGNDKTHADRYPYHVKTILRFKR